MTSSPFDKSLESKVTLETESASLLEDLPFHLLVIGDWGGASDFSSKPVSARAFIEIDRDESDDVMRKITPQVNLKFNQSGNTLLRLTFESLDDFHPDSIFQRVALFKDLREIRRKLTKADTFEEAAREVRSWYTDSTEELKKDVADSEFSGNGFESGSLLDQILDNKSVNVSSSQRISTSPLGEFIGNIVAPHLVKTDFEEQSRLLMIVDEIISDLMRRILHHQDFQRLEAAWRGLYFLVRRVETGSHLKVFLAQLTKDELLNDLSSVDSLSHSQFYKWIVGDNELSTESSSLAAVCGNYEFAPTVEDTAALIRVAKVSKKAKCPFIARINTQLFGVSSLADFPNSGFWKISQESPEFKLWSALRSMPESVCLGLALPGFLGRLPYGEQTEPTEAFAFEEFEDSPTHNNYLWLNPAFACVYALARQYSLNEWKINQDSATDLEYIPLHIYKFQGETKTTSSAEIYMTENIYKSISDQGIMTLIALKNQHLLRLSALRSISSESTSLQGKW